MINLLSILPDLERAVDDRVDSPALLRLESEDLRHLIYKLVERLRNASHDPSQHFADLVENASVRHADMTQARDHSVQVRAAVLKHLLVVLKPAIPSLIGSVVIETVKRAGQDVQRVHHPTARGFQILNQTKEVQTAPSTYIRSGQSWWLGVFEGAEGYALMRHFGEIDERGIGRTWSELHAFSPQEAAAQIHDDAFHAILFTIHARLVALTGKKVAKITDELWDVANVLDSGLEAMKKMENQK